MLEHKMMARILARDAAENCIIKIFKILLLKKYNQTALNRTWT